MFRLFNDELSFNNWLLRLLDVQTEKHVDKL